MSLSERAAETFRVAGFDEERLFYLPRGVDVERFTPGERPPHFRAVFAGALIERKGVHHLLEAWHRLALKDAELWLVGSLHDEMKPYLKQYANESVKVIGFASAPEKYLRHSTVHVFPSQCEGSAKVTYEAAACGLPQITTKEAGDVVEDGIQGIIVPPADVEHSRCCDPDTLRSSRACGENEPRGSATRGRPLHLGSFPPSPPRCLRNGDAENCQSRLNFLLIQLKRIGDLILTVPAIAAVREEFPEAKLTLVVAHGSREMLPAIPGIDRALVARGRVSDAPQWFALAAGRFDYCLDFSRTDRSAFLTLLSNARERITYETIRHEPLRRLSYNQFVPSRVRELHTIDHHLELLAPLGINNGSGIVHLELPEEAKEEAAKAIASYEVGEDFVVLHPGSARTEKFWLAERWAEVADHLQASGLPVVLTGGTSRTEKDHLERIKALVANPVIDLSGKLNLLSVAALIQRARLLGDGRLRTDAFGRGARHSADRSFRAH